MRRKHYYNNVVAKTKRIICSYVEDLWTEVFKKREKVGEKLLAVTLIIINLLRSLHVSHSCAVP